MKTIKLRFRLLVSALLIVCSGSSFAFGLGFTVGTGTEDWDDFNGDRDVSNVGFVMDTTIARNKLFNYRLSLMNEEITIDNGNAGIELDGTAMNHDFGFALLRTKVARLWIGPRLRFGWYDGKVGNQFFQVEEDFIGFGLGPVIGLNIHLPQVVTFSLTGGVMLTGFYAGEDVYDDDYEYDGTYFNASILFRFGGDSFRR